MMARTAFSALTTLTGRHWLFLGIAFVLTVIVAANGHFLYVAFTSQPGCAAETSVRHADGSLQTLRPARAGC
jgi:nitrogen fixation protein FixH